MNDRPFRNYSDEVLAWWAGHIDAGGCKMCPSTTSPEVAAQVRKELARRKPSAKARPNKAKRGTNV